MRDRLIELLTKTFDEQYEKRMLITPQHTADHLLANGVIVPPCKIEDEIWFIENWGFTTRRISHGYVIRFDARKMWGLGFAKNIVIQPTDTLEDRLYFARFKDVGKSFFLTKEEAEKALAEMSKG